MTLKTKLPKGMTADDFRNVRIVDTHNREAAALVSELLDRIGGFVWVRCHMPGGRSPRDFAQVGAVRAFPEVAAQLIGELLDIHAKKQTKALPR